MLLFFFCPPISLLQTTFSLSIYFNLTFLVYRKCHHRIAPPIYIDLLYSAPVQPSIMVVILFVYITSQKDVRSAVIFLMKFVGFFFSPQSPLSMWTQLVCQALKKGGTKLVFGDIEKRELNYISISAGT